MDRQGNSRNFRDWTIITDLDGTIIDSESTNFSILATLLEEFDLTRHRTIILEGLGEGKDFSEIMKRINLDEETKVKMENRMISLLTRAPTPSLPGAVDNLRYLRGLGIIFCLATDNYSQFVARVVQELDLSDVFDSRFILTSDTFDHRKPSPIIVSELLERTGRKKAMVIGNSPKEVALARGSGIPGVIISNGTGIESDTGKRKDTFEYEWKSHGGFDGENIIVVKDWEEVKEVTIGLLKQGNSGGYPS